MSQQRRQFGSNAFPAPKPFHPPKASTSKSACRTCDAGNYSHAGNSVVLNQTFVGSAPTMVDLMYPNQPSSGYRAGKQAYQAARGKISVEQFNAELAVAFLYFQQRFGLPSVYYLTPILSYTDTTNFTPQDLSAANLLGLPLSTITYFDTNQVKQTWGYYRPEVYCEDVKVACAKLGGKCNGAGKFRKVLLAEHTIFIVPVPRLQEQQGVMGIESVGNPTSTLTIVPATPSEYVPVINGQAVPPRVFPQYANNVETILPFRTAIYGYATLVSGPSDNVKTTDIAYRSLYPSIFNVSTSSQDYYQIPAGQFQGAVYNGFPVQAASCQLGSGDFEGTSIIQRCRDIRGNSANDLLAPVQPVIPFPLVFDANGGWLILTQGVTFVFPKPVVCPE